MREVIAKTVVKKKSGGKNYILKDVEAYIVATSEIDGAHWLPRDTIILTNELQQLVRDVGKQSIINRIQSKYSQRYARRVVRRVNREYKESEG